MPLRAIVVSEQEHPPSAAEARRQVDAACGPIVRASQELLRAGDELLIATPTVYIDGASNIVSAETIRASKTFGANIRLGRDGYGEQAFVLARTLFETALSACWAHLNPDLAFERYVLHSKLLNLRTYEAFVATGGIFDAGSPPPPMTTAEMKEAEDLFGQRATGYWTGHRNLRELVASVQSNWTSEFERRLLWAYFEVIHGYANRLAHSNPISVGSAFQVEEDHHVFNVGPSAANVRHAVTAGTYCYVVAMGIFMDHYSVSEDARNDFERAQRRCWESWQDNAALRQLGRNDPCLCRSGKKYKNCHGAPI